MSKRRYVGVVLLAALVFAVAACGAGESGKSGQGESSGRMIEHAMGETEVSENPERVVVLDTGELDSAITLGIVPVGAVEAIPGQGFLSYLEGTEGIENVGTIEQPNLEAIALLEPDLILSSNMRHEDIYEELSGIAPTVFTERTGVTWKENFDLHAEALNRTEEAELVKSEYQGRIQEFQEAMGDRLNETEVSVVRFLPDQVRLYQKGSFVGTVLEDAGLLRPESQRDESETFLEANKEQIGDLNADVMFVSTYGPAEETPVEEFQGDPLWSGLEVVQGGRVYEVPDDLWMLGIGYTAANGVVDDLSRYLVG